MRLDLLPNLEFIRGQDVRHYTQQHHENGHGHDDDVVTDARKEEKNKQTVTSNKAWSFGSIKRFDASSFTP